MSAARNNPAKHWRESPPIGFCEPCGKKIYLNRKAARRAAKRLHTEDPPRAYPCMVTDSWWHVGHLPEAVVVGRIDRGEYRAHLPGGVR